MFQQSNTDCYAYYQPANDVDHVRTSKRKESLKKGEKNFTFFPFFCVCEMIYTEF